MHSADLRMECVIANAMRTKNLPLVLSVNDSGLDPLHDLQPFRRDVRVSFAQRHPPWLHFFDGRLDYQVLFLLLVGLIFILVTRILVFRLAGVVVIVKAPTVEQGVALCPSLPMLVLGTN